jgi:hypothetical protein
LELTVPLVSIISRKRLNGFRSLGVDVSKEVPLDLVIDRLSEEGRVKVFLLKAARRGKREPIVKSDDAPVVEHLLLRRQIKIGELLAARLKEAFLVPLRNVMVVSCL